MVEDTTVTVVAAFEESGLNCEVVMFMGHYCGYVDVPKGHPLFGKSYEEDQNVNDLDIHGGITYSDPNGTFWRFGWDAAHCGDYNPIFGDAFAFNRDATRWTDENAIEETRRLAVQLAGMVG